MNTYDDVTYEWTDFVICTLSPDVINSKDRRLGIGIEHLSEENKFHTITKDHCVYDDDEFEAMLIEGASIMIWTLKKVWVIRREGPMERLLYLPRHPETRYRYDNSQNHEC